MFEIPIQKVYIISIKLTYDVYMYDYNCFLMMQVKLEQRFSGTIFDVNCE